MKLTAKRILSFSTTVFTILIACILSSCSAELEPQSPETNVTLTSSLSQEDFHNICDHLNFKVISRSEPLSETNCRQALKPLIADGQSLKKQLVTQAKLNPALEYDAKYFEGLNEEDCAALSFIFHASIEAGNIQEVSGLISTTDDPNAPKVSKERLVSCVGVATGIVAIYDFVTSVQGIVSAATVREALIVIGRRYLGYIGIIVMIAEFTNCIYGH